jgi:hypothetical protein
MSRLIRLDESGHTVLAEWTSGDHRATAQAASVLRDELERGQLAVVPRADGSAEQVRQLPPDAPLVILRRPIAGG